MKTKQLREQQTLDFTASTGCGLFADFHAHTGPVPGGPKPAHLARCQPTSPPCPARRSTRTGAPVCVAHRSKVLQPLDLGPSGRCAGRAAGLQSRPLRSPPAPCASAVAPGRPRWVGWCPPHQVLKQATADLDSNPTGSQSDPKTDEPKYCSLQHSTRPVNPTYLATTTRIS